jgi:major membrane immunogen (membrane-anchored lipoprotein)
MSTSPKVATRSHQAEKLHDEEEQTCNEGEKNRSDEKNSDDKKQHDWLQHGQNKGKVVNVEMRKDRPKSERNNKNADDENVREKRKGIGKEKSKNQSLVKK